MGTSMSQPGLETSPSTFTKSDQELIDLILIEKKKLGSQLMILGHHYQRASIVKLADKIGDSFGLAKAAAEANDVQKIVFCGVRFMAESAAILCRDDQKVYHPEPEAGCPMADMAPMDSVELAWQYLSQHPQLKDKKVIPVTYMNSHAPLKSFTGKNGGLVCTSSNAKQALEWAYQNGDVVFFFPDQHLGRNTGKNLGFSEEQMPVWYPSKHQGGIDNFEKCKMILWNGNCPVHMKFHARDLRFVRKHFPQAKIAVHPECTAEVVALADAVGSTEFLVNYVRGLSAGSQVFVGTEVHLIDRLKAENPKIKIEALFRSLCPTMYMVDLQKLLYCLQTFDEKLLVPMESVSKAQAKLSLERMLALPRNG